MLPLKRAESPLHLQMLELLALKLEVRWKDNDAYVSYILLVLPGALYLGGMSTVRVCVVIYFMQRQPLCIGGGTIAALVPLLYSNVGKTHTTDVDFIC